MKAPAETLKDVQRTGNARYDLLPDGSGVLVSLPNLVPSQFEASLSQIEEHLSIFGGLRAKLLPSVSENWTGGKMVACAGSPTVTLGTSMMTGDVLFHIRDEGFGWLHYAFSRETARLLGGNLIALADAPLPAAGQA